MTLVAIFVGISMFGLLSITADAPMSTGGLIYHTTTMIVISVLVGIVVGMFYEVLA